MDGVHSFTGPVKFRAQYIVVGVILRLHQTEPPLPGDPDLYREFGYSTEDLTPVGRYLDITWIAQQVDGQFVGIVQYDCPVTVV